MLLHYFKSLCHANGARTPRKGRGANPWVLVVRGAHLLRGAHIFLVWLQRGSQRCGVSYADTLLPAWVVSATVASMLCCYVL